MASLPPELEQAIFQSAAYSQPTFVPTLKLVAWRVNEWVNKYLYRILMLRGRETYNYDGWEDYPCDDDALFTRLKSIHPSVLRDSVRHLYLEVMPIDLCRYLLSTCTAVEDLWINQSDSSLLDLVAALPLRRLHCHLGCLFTQAQLDFGHPLFSNLTHIEWFFGFPGNQEFNPSSWTGLASIPHLTHLSFTEPVFLPLVPSLLQDCKLLRVLVFILDSDWMDANEASAMLSSTTPGPHFRFVLMECAAFGKDWRSGALGRGDYWDRAEAFVAKRMSNEIDPALYVLEGDESVLIVD